MNLSTAVVAKLALALLLGSASAISTTLPKWDKLLEDVNNSDETATELVYKNWTKRSSSFVKGLTSDSMERILAKALNIENLNVWRGDRSKGSSLDKVRGIIYALTRDELRDFGLETCSVVTEFLHFVKSPEHIANSQCRQSYYDKLRGLEVLTVTIRNIPPKWIQEDGTAPIEVIRDEDFKELPVETIKEIMKNKDEICAKISPEILFHLNKEKLALVTPECFSSLKKIHKKDISKVVPLLPSKILTKHTGNLHQLTWRSLTPAQVEALNSELEEGEICNFSLEHISPRSFSSVTTKCLQGSLSTPRKYGALWRRVTSSTIKAIKENQMDLVGNIHPEDFEFLSDDVLQIFFDSEIAIENLPKNADSPIKLSTRQKDIKLTKERFAAIASRVPEVAGQLLLTVKDLPDDILSKCEGEDIVNLNAPKDGETLSGGELIAAMRIRKNYKLIVNSMTNDAATHFCSTITDSNVYLEADWLRPHASQKCRDSLNFVKTSPDFISRAPEFAKEEDAWKNVLSDFSNRDWESVKKGLFAFLVEKPEFCKALTEEEHKNIINLIPDKVKRLINGECAFIMKSLITPELVGKLAEDALSKFTSESFIFKLTDLRVDQVPFISSGIFVDYLKPTNEELKKHVFATKITADVIKALDNPRLAAISSWSWHVMPVANMSVLTVEQLKVLLPSNMTRFTDAHLEAIVAEVLAEISSEQIAEVGKDTNISLAALEKISAKLKAPEVEALNARKAAALKGSNPSSEDSSCMMWWIIGGVVAIIVIGGVVFFVVRK